YWRGFHIINVGYFLNAVLPFRIGEFARILLVSREPEQNIGVGLSAVTVERLFDLMMALLCVGLGLALVPESKTLPQDAREGLGFFIVITVMGGLVLLALPRSHPILMHIARLVTRPLPGSIGGLLVGFAEDTLNSLRAISDLRILLEMLVWSLVTWCSYVGFFYIGLFSFFDSVNIGVGFLVTGFVAVGIAAPSLPGAIGIFQAAAVLALSTAGYDTAAATGYAWTLWIVQTVAILAGGVVGLWAMSLSFTGLTQDVRENIEKLDVHQTAPE
ncbi:MAG TPA: lysylphosphatidylglycerol synthase transmembrane domain-containing protein, partial [Aggregatilineales bacterium]|nr:lysylphosphatidylglycerol synthase transmembrane domain-containing protein [Aggregatilineales bacterium]